MPRSSLRSARRGFTLTELAMVIAILAILTGLAAPTYQVYRLRALATEATLNLETIAYLEKVAVLETGSTIACPAEPATLPAPTATFDSSGAWADLGFAPVGAVRFQYEVLSRGEEGFLAVARGDLNRNGIVSTYRIDGTTLELTSENPGE